MPLKVRVRGTHLALAATVAAGAAVYWLTRAPEIGPDRAATTEPPVAVDRTVAGAGTSDADFALAFGPSGRPDGDAAADDGTLNDHLPSETPGEGDAADPEPVERLTVKVDRGDTLMGLLVESGIARAEAHDAIVALRPMYDPRKLRMGQELTLELGPPDAGKGRLRTVSVPLSYDRSVEAVRTEDGGFSVREVARPHIRKLVRADATIRSSLFEAGIEAGIPAPVLIELIRAYSFDIDFQREVQPGDRIEVMYEQFYDPDSGAPTHAGNILVADFTLNGESHRIYRHTTATGITDYFNPAGESVRKALMRTPVDGARLSSGFGMRKHPILGYSRMHRGIDFAAPRGTPIMAAGKGVVEYAGRNGGYGRYVRIRHNGIYKTAYAHLKAIAKGIRKGRRVRQGQIIGYVGSSGRSTGPHLHYEVLYKGRQVNPMKLKLPAGGRLEGLEMVRFKRERARLDARFAALASETAVARRGN